ncbi:MAG: hypothetical protein DMF64_10825 [Acidobacteria bacterium]|nr:MAG: hypothetical protein DMF64_10825 [Acidobacteriota bacterium]
MRIKLRVIDVMPSTTRNVRKSWPQMLRSKLSYALFGLLLLCAPLCVAAQESPQPTPTTAPTPTASPSPQSPPAGTNTQQQLPPNAAGSTVRPGNEAQQSTQPQPVPQQQQQQTTPNTQGPRPTTPQIQNPTNPTSGLPTTANPVGTAAPQQGAPTTTTTGTGQTGVPLAPGQNVGTSPIAPAQLPPEPPPVAPNYQAPARPLPAPDRVGVNVNDQLPLALNDAIALALKNSNDIDESRINVQIAEFNLLAARGVYDPLFSSEDYYERSTTPTSSSIGGGGTRGAVTQVDETGSARLGGFSPIAGGSYQFDFSSTRLTTTNQNVRLNPQFPTAFTFTYTQPLLRGLRFDANRHGIEVAKKNLSLTDAQFRQQVIDVITQVEQAYWDLVFALRNLQVQIDAVKQARLQVESNQRLVQQGVLAPIDIVAATTQVTTFEQNVYTAQQAVTRAENTLKTLMLPNRLDAMWGRALTPITPVNLEAPRVPLEQAVQSALASRPELAQLRTNADINQLDVRYFRDLTKPQINLVGTYTSDGLAGRLVVPSQNSSTSSTLVLTDRVNQLSALAGLPPLTVTSTTTTVAPQLIGGYTQSLRNLLEQRYPTARIGVTISLPLRNRTAEANLGRTLAQGHQLKDQLAQTEQIIEADVRNTLQAVRSAEARRAAAAAARSSAEQQYASEQRQFRAGTTTVFLVLQRQTELLSARANELQAQTDLNKAISDFQRATGNTLEVNHVAVRTDTRQLEQRTLDADTLGTETTTRTLAPNAATNINNRP